MKRLLGAVLACFLLVSAAAEANQAFSASGVTTTGNTVDIPAQEYHVVTLCITVASGALTGIQLQTKDATGVYYNIGAALTTTGCTTVSEYAQSGANVGLGSMVRANWTIGTANFSYSLHLKR